MRPVGSPGAGRWTDDTSMALGIATALLAYPLMGEELYDAIAQNFLDWSMEDGSGIGNQTAAILGECTRATSAAQQRQLALAYSQATSRAAGNGSLMRIHPVALVSDDRHVVAELAREITRLTYVDERCLDISVLWCEVLRVARLTGELQPTAGLDLLPESSRGPMAALIDEALTTPSTQFSTQGWWVVPAFQQALSAVAHHVGDLPETVFAEIIDAVESDSDTICCIAGGLLGALGNDAVPASELALIHGEWPEPMRAQDLSRLEDELLDLAIG